MRLDRLRVKGMGVLKDVDLDLTKITGCLVAICGANGTGKSTLLSMFPAALYRDAGDRGSLKDLATGRDSYVEATVKNGRSWVLRHTIDGQSNKGESLVLDDTGAPAFASAKRKDFDSWAETHLPSSEVFYASVFAAQGSGGFLELDPGEKKAVLLRTLGIERLEVLAELAREQARLAGATADVARARVDDEARRAEPVEHAVTALDLARASADAARATADAASAGATAAWRDAVAWDAAEDARRAFALERGRLDEQRARIEVEVADVTQRLANNRRLRADGEAVLAAEASLGELRARLDTALAALASAQGARAALRAAVDAAASATKAAERAHDDGRRAEDDAGRRVETARKRAASADARATEARRALATRPDVEAATASIPDLESEVERAKTGLEDAEKQVEAAAARRAVGADDRIDGLRTALGLIAAGAERPREEAQQAIDDDDATVASAASVPAEIATRRAERDEARKALEDVRARLEVARRIAARAEALVAAQTQLDDALEGRRAADAEAAEAEGQLAAARDRRGAERAAVGDAHVAHRAAREALDADTSHDDAIAVQRRADEELAAAEARAKRAPQVRDVDQRIAELERRLAGAEGELGQVRAALDALPAPAPAPSTPRPDPDVAGAAARAAEERTKVAVAAVTRAEARHEATIAADAQIVELRAALAGAEAEQADWTKIGADLGRDGLQALEIDCAIPELAELTNDLLHRCVTTRWTVSLETSFASANGKKQLEGLRVNVSDAENGTDGEASRLSGGERVIVGEALSLALTMLATRRSGMRGATLVRDETSAALDQTNAVAYIAMLRRAAELVDADHVLFVAHAPLLHDLADARINVENGVVRVAS